MPDLENQSNSNETFDGLDPDHPALKALRAEREARKKAERQAKFVEVLAKYPNVGLKAEDFEGLTPDKWEARAERLASLAGPSNIPQPQEPVAPVPTDAFTRMSAPVEGAPPTGEGKKLGLEEAWQLFRRNPAEFERLKQAGRIDLGMTPVERGGSVFFERNY